MKARKKDLVDEICRRDFTAFCHRFFEVLNPGKRIQRNWHIDASCYALQKIVESKAPNRLVFNMPPRSLKTFIVTICLPAWLLGRDPSLRIITASYSEELAFKFSRECRALMESQFFKRIFRTRLNPKKITEAEFETTRRGWRYATSVGGTLTGRGGDVLIIDDLIKAGESVSKTQLVAANEWFRNTALSRLDNPARGVILVVMQRLHADDLSGILIEAGWPSLVFPAIAPEAQRYAIGEGEFYDRPAGEPLQPRWLNSADYEQIKQDIGSHLFAAQYQQDPTPAEGNMIKADWLKRFKKRPENFDRIIASVDPAAATGRNNDYTAVVILGIKEKHLYVLHAERGRWGIMAAMDNIERLAREWRADLVIVENTSSGVSLIPLLKERANMNVVGTAPNAKKEVRMARHQGRIEAGRLILPEEAPWLADFENELLSFPSGRYDDQVDALLLLLEWYAENEQYLEPICGVTLWVNTVENPFDPERFTYRVW